MSMSECIVERINIRSQYPASAYLFSCLASPGGDPVAAKVAAASSIKCSTKLQAISRLLRDLSAALKDVSAIKAAQLLRPIHDKQVFPIKLRRVGETTFDGFDQLSKPSDTNWYIADQSDVRDSILGTVPLLALPVEDVIAIRDLITILRLEDRLLSKYARSQSQLVGRVALYRPLTALIHERAPFIKAYALPL
jgi:hypothetical protein